MSLHRLWSLAFGALLISAPVCAHHSAAMFDDKQCVTLTGTVQKINMSYPHVWIFMAVPDAKQATVNWALENTDPSSLRVQGWSPTTVKKGDKLTVVASPSRDQRKIAVIRLTRLADGRTFASGGPNICVVPAGPTGSRR
jgi:Family of unknown function (DUF6152)